MKEPSDHAPARAAYVGSTLQMAVDDRAGAPRVSLTGELDLAAMRRLRTLLRDLRRRGPARIEVDLEQLSLLETVTAASLIRERSEARRDGVELTLEGARGPVGRLLELAEQRLG